MYYHQVVVMIFIWNVTCPLHGAARRYVGNRVLLYGRREIAVREKQTISAREIAFRPCRELTKTRLNLKTIAFLDFSKLNNSKPLA